MRSSLIAVLSSIALTACPGSTNKTPPAPVVEPNPAAPAVEPEPVEPVVEAPPPAPDPPPPPPWEPLDLQPLASTGIIHATLLDAPAEGAEPAKPGAQLFPERYSEVPGVLSFRGDHTRSSAAYGTATITEKKLELVWTHETRTSTPRAEGSTRKNWGGGAGWTGQPALVQWPADTRGAMNLLPELAADDDFVEVIQGSLDGHVYFLDLRTGLPSRQASFHNFRSQADDATTIEVGHPIKGSVSIDPRGWPILYVGQGIAEGSEFGFRAYSLIDGQRLLYLDGRDPKALRRWGAFDSSAVVNRISDTMFVGGENGLVYRVALNSAFDPAAPSLTLAPVVERLRYTLEGADGRKKGVENSITAWKNLAWFADNGGGIVAVNTDSFEPVWAWFGEQADDTNASIVVEVTDDQPALFLGTEIEYQEGRSDKAWVHRFDGLTGEPLWSVGYDARPAKKGLNLSGGVYGTPVPGQHKVADKLFVSVVEVGNLGAGLLVALDKQTGQELWRNVLPSYAWSSPLVIYDADGNGYLVLGDSAGDVVLYDAADGQELHRISLGYLVEASPAFMNDMIVLAVRGKAVHGIAVR